MLKTLFTLCAVTVLCSGCLIMDDDPAARRAVAAYRSIRHDIPEKITLASALTWSDTGAHGEVRVLFSRLHEARALANCYTEPLQKDQLRNALLAAETSRIKLNALLKFAPDASVVYDTAGAFDTPDELPDLQTVNKAALVNRAATAEPLKILCETSLCHAEAVSAYDAAAFAVSPAEKISAMRRKVECCVNLADAAGCSFTELSALPATAARFDRADR